MEKQKDRITFFQSVEQNNEDYASVITSLFDQFSLLYNLVGQYQVRVINTTSLSNVQFELVCSDEEQLNTIFNNILLKGNYTELYGRIFEISIKKKDNLTLKIKLVSKEPTAIVR